MDVLQDRHLHALFLDKERKGIFKVRDFEKDFAKYYGAKLRPGGHVGLLRP